MKCFTALTIAKRQPTSWQIELKYSTHFLIANSEEEAIGILMKDVREKFPKEDGWFGHDYLATELTKENLKTALSQMG